MVCCPSNNNPVPERGSGGTNFPGTLPNTNQPGQPSQPTGNQNVRFDLASNSLLPNICGKSLSQRIVGGEKTELDEFPWMALLEYRKPTGLSTACGGVLINSRYVLTAAHCIRGKDLPTTWRLQSVRLGEYNTETEVDCIKDDEDTQLCADDPISVGVEEQIPHEDYRPLSRDQKNDIALLRLTQDVTFTNYIRPICLPADASMGVKLFVAGWGKTENRSASAEKLKLSLPLSAPDECRSTYNSAGVSIGHGQICAGGQKGKDSCRGDSGGPLMALEQNPDRTFKFTVVGVVSFGPSPCGMQGWPGVYTRVYDFMPWILSKLRP